MASRIFLRLHPIFYYKLHYAAHSKDLILLRHGCYVPIVIPKEPETLSARDLLSEYNTIKIPDYQRHYTWETENVKQFFDDIIDDASKFSPHNPLGRSARTSVFGTIIGMLEIKEGLNDSNNYRDYDFIIIDGQQRISTLNFLILCLCSFTKEFSKDMPALMQIFSDMRNYLVKNSELSNPSPRLILNYTDREYWNKIIRIFFTPNTDSEMNFKNTIKEMSNFIKIEKNETKIHKSLNEMYENLEIFFSHDDEVNKKAEKLVMLWEWINSTSDYGLRFTKIVEDDIHTALMRFDRENNRGVRVRMDDLAKSYLIEAIERSSQSPEVKKRDKEEVLEYWKAFQRDSKGLNKEKIIQWFLITRTGHPNIDGPDSVKGRWLMTNIFRKNLDIDSQRGSYLARDDRIWKPVDIARDLAHWVKIYQTIIKERELTDEKTYYNIMFLKNLTSPWPFIVALSLACSKGNDYDVPWDWETSTICNLPIQLMAELEYSVISQVIISDYSGQQWEARYRQWAAILGRCFYELTFEDVKRLSTKSRASKLGIYFEKKKHLIDDFIMYVSNDMEEFNASEGHDYDFNNYLKKYRSSVDSAKFSGNVLPSRNRAAHIRILKQAEYFISNEKVANLLSNTKKGLTLEHIFPKKSDHWKEDSNYSGNEMNQLRLLLQHIGNHTMVSDDFNNILGNKKFREKQYGALENDTEKAEEECYSNSGLQITKALANPTIGKWEPETLLKRGEVLLRIWAMNSAERIAKNVRPVNQSEEYLIKPIEDTTMRNLYTLINGNESTKLEFKAAYFSRSLKNASTISRLNHAKVEITDLLCRVNGTINAFANTAGGDLIIGKHDSATETNEVAGLGSMLDAYYTKLKSKGKELTHAAEEMVNDISDNIRLWYPYQKYPIDYEVNGYFVKNNKGREVFIVHIKVEKYRNGPVPFNTPHCLSQTYYKRHAAQNIVYDLNDSSKFALRGDDEYKGGMEMAFEEKIKANQTKASMIGPFLSKDDALEFREKLIISNQITKNNIPSRSAVKAITFKSKAIFGHYCNSMLKNGSWKHKVQKINQHTNQKVELDGCYIFNLEGLELDWKLRTQKKETDELEKPRQDNETQKDMLLNLILDFAEEKHKTIFGRDEFLKLNDLSKLWPKTKTPEQTFSRLMQELRDDGWIKFLDKKGVYEIL